MKYLLISLVLLAGCASNKEHNRQLADDMRKCEAEGQRWQMTINSEGSYVECGPWVK